MSDFRAEVFVEDPGTRTASFDAEISPYSRFEADLGSPVGTGAGDADSNIDVIVCIDARVLPNVYQGERGLSRGGGNPHAGGKHHDDSQEASGYPGVFVRKECLLLV